jgi:hypothetical protein
MVEAAHYTVFQGTGMYSTTIFLQAFSGRTGFDKPAMFVPSGKWTRSERRDSRIDPGRVQKVGNMLTMRTLSPKIAKCDHYPYAQAITSASDDAQRNVTKPLVTQRH